MTFAVLAADGAGGFGMAVSSSSPAVAARCVHLRPGVGGVASQNVTDPRLGARLLDALETGQPAAEALQALVAEEPDIVHRQLMVVDATGGVAAFSGERTLGLYATAEGSGVVAAGNLLAADTVPRVMVEAYETSDGETEQRLLAALRAGLDAGGEAGPVRSAGVVAVREVSWPVTDLRVDWHDDPVAELARLWEVWSPQRDDYVRRAVAPDTAPSYGVPGDE